MMLRPFGIVLLCGTCFLSYLESIAQELNLEHVSSAFDRPIFGTFAPGESNRMFVLEQHTGNIEILNVDSGQVNADPFLTVQGISTGGEQGLLGMAFHPDYQTNGQFYVNYTNASGHTVVEQYVRDSINSASPTGTQVIQINQPGPFHNAGWMGFGQDDMLYVATGDGDIPGNSRDITNNLLGKILRLDVNGDDFAGDNSRNYAIPADNPFVGMAGDDEIFAYGLRNPWRNSFDRLTGDLYIADVGDGEREEISFLRNGGGGEDFGWDVREGTFGGTKGPGMIDPIYDYGHGIGDLEGFSVTGGYVYRGPIEALQGHYFFTDFVTNNLWSFKFDGTLNSGDFDGTNYTDFIRWNDYLSTDVGNIANLSSFAEDEFGNLYTIGLGGSIYRFASASIPEPVHGLAMIAIGLTLVRRRRN